MDDQQSDTLTTQQTLVLQQKHQAIELVDRANESLDGKATTLWQASGLIFGLVGVLAVPGFVTDNPAGWVKMGLFFAFCAFAGMVILSTAAWWPGDYPVPGIRVWNDIYDQYILSDTDTCYQQVLRDAIEVQRRLMDINARKSWLIVGSAALFLLQVTVLLALALFA